MAGSGRESEGTVRWRLRVRGLVQGVNFRAATRQEARAAGVAGWVRNRDDGSVEIEAQGPRSAVETLAAWARRGPPVAKVDAVEVDEIAPREAESGFRVVA